MLSQREIQSCEGNSCLHQKNETIDHVHKDDAPIKGSPGQKQEEDQEETHEELEDEVTVSGCQCQNGNRQQTDSQSLEIAFTLPMLRSGGLQRRWTAYLSHSIYNNQYSFDLYESNTNNDVSGQASCPHRDY